MVKRVTLQLIVLQLDVRSHALFVGVSNIMLNNAQREKLVSSAKKEVIVQMIALKEAMEDPRVLKYVSSVGILAMKCFHAGTTILTMI